MSGVGITEIVLILFIAIIVIGPKEAAKLFQKGRHLLGQFRKAMNDVKEETAIEEELNHFKAEIKELQKQASVGNQTFIDQKSDVNSIRKEKHRYRGSGR